LAFLDGTLPAGARAEAEVHVASCRACTDLTTLAAADLASRKRGGDRRRPMIGELAIGAQVGRYQILAPIGRGGMGEVYAAHHPDLDRRIALKIVDESGPDSAERRARLLREARAIARLSHPNVVTVHDAGTVGDRVYIAMELVEGETVDAWLRAARRTWREVVDVFIAAGRGLAAAHAAEIIHRDFKPQNIMVGKDGTVRVMDFGLARLVNDELAVGPRSEAPDAAAHQRSATVTKTGALLGTPAYMAPEQFRGGPTDARSDQFSYCVALHEALYGLRPRLAHLDAEGQAAGTTTLTPTERRGGVPAWLRGAVVRGLREDPALRFASMNQLLLVLDRGRTRRRRRMFAATASLAVALTVLGGWRISHPARFECKPSPSRLAAAWPLEGGPGSRRDALERALLASGRSEAATVWRRMSALLDDHVGSWTAMYQEACEATHLRGEQSMEVLDLRMHCLANNLDEVRALADVLIAADARAVGQAAAAAGALASPAICGDVALLRSKVPLPRDEPTRRKVEALQRALHDTRALRELGYPQVALDKARVLQLDVEAMRYPPLIAELLFEIGTIKCDLADFVGGETTAKDAFVAAEAANDDALRAKAASNLVFYAGMQGRREESELWARDANAILDRLGASHARTRSWVLNNQAAVLNQHGEFGHARRLLEQAIAVKESVVGRDHPDVAHTLIALGVTLTGMGQLEAALAAEDRALAIWNAQGSLFAAKVENNRGEILAALGRNREAERAFERALRGIERDTGPENVELAFPLIGLAEIKLAARDLRAAVSLFERALDLRGRKEKIPALVAEARFGLARALWVSGARVRAVALARSARTAYDDGHHAQDLAKVDAWLAARAPMRQRR
jgi:eukaryotic-like serine/threonine-protein kinase